MNGQKTSKRTKVVAIRATTYDRIIAYAKRQEAPPTVVGVVSAAVEAWLDEQESK